ncbi:MAG: hypothetical protein WBQ75_18785, partial [Acetobacteraceae bacterium]
MLNVIVTGPPAAFAAVIAARNEPAPESFRLLTTNDATGCLPFRAILTMDSAISTPQHNPDATRCCPGSAHMRRGGVSLAAGVEILGWGEVAKGLMWPEVVEVMGEA